MKALVSWSGGKETSLACYKAIHRKGIEVKYFLNMVSEDGKHSRSHGLSAALLKTQAKAMGIPIVQRRTTWESYEKVFKKTALELKSKGIDAGVFGDIDIQEHRDWIERVCKEIAIKPILPLWKEKREKLLKEFIDAGFKAMVVSSRADLLGKEWLGRQINEDFIKDLKRAKNIDLCGEKGEYHTFVYAGPTFKKPLEFTAGKKKLKDKHWFLELKLKEK